MAYVILIVFLLFISVSILSAFTIYKKKDSFEGTIGIKNYVSTICFFVIGIIGFLSSALNYLGAPVWFAIILFLMIGAYYTKYLPKPKQTDDR